MIKTWGQEIQFVKLESMRIRNEETEESQDLTNTTAGAEGCFMQMWVHKEGPSPEDSLRGNLCYQMYTNIRVKPHTKGNKIDKR